MKPIKLVLRILSIFGFSFPCSPMQSEQVRLSVLLNSGSSNDGIHVLFQSTKKLNKHDAAALRMDARRAIAAYPSIPEDKLLFGRWFAFDPSARVSTKGYWNSHGVQDPITKEWYLESAYISVVRPEYPDRATDADTNSFFEKRKIDRKATKLARLQADGPFATYSGTGGSFSVSLDKSINRVVIIHAKEWANRAQRWTIPFVLTEWLNISENDFQAIQNLPSFKQAVYDETDVMPIGTTFSVR